MRDCQRNLISFWYAPYLRKEPVTVNGSETGQYREIYGDPIAAKAPISNCVGAADMELFGTALQYDRVITTVQDLPGLNEYSKVWIETDPDGGKALPDYRVKRTAKGLNQNLWAIQREVR